MHVFCHGLPTGVTQSIGPARSCDTGQIVVHGWLVTEIVERDMTRRGRRRMVAKGAEYKSEHQ